MVEDYKQTYLSGIDIGSTTVKVVICDNSGKPVFSRYRRHNAVILDTALYMLKEAHDEMGDIQLNLAVTGSAGMGVAESLGIPFVQEVVASAKLIKTCYHDVRTLIEIGGEDSKIVFFDDRFRPDIRMNGSCAGGTGAFIDQMAVLLDVSIADLDQLAKESTSIHPIASRCGVFAKTDIQALLSNKVSREDIAASVFHAVALQVITTLARGSDIKKKVLFAGGPLKFFPQLQKAFIDILGLNIKEDLVIPEHPEFIPAIGAALVNMVNRVNRDSALFNQRAEGVVSVTNKKGAVPIYEITIQKLIQLIKTDKIRVPQGSEINRLSPLFSDPSEFEAWEKRHAQQIVKKIDISKIDGKLCFLGVDSGSTTTKLVLIDSEGRVALTHYASNDGDSIQAVREGLNKFQEEFQKAGITPRIVRTAATGYGEDLIRAAFDLDDGVVETMAHLRAARYFDKDVSFILDIGGQDMKAIYVNDGAVSDIQVNEACSSGCGSFIETFAHSLGHDVSQFAGLACQKNVPFDLGSRCTVFMNSRVKQALREGATVSDISAGLAYSVIKNSLYKVLKLKDSDTLGEKIVAQGGTFRNPAVLRAFEILLGREVIRPDISELMGAYGAALTARRNYQTDSVEVAQFSGFNSLDQEVGFTTKNLHCKGCENRCSVKSLTFKNGRSYFTGNRCERYFTNGSSSKEHGGNLIAAKFKLLFDRKTEPDRSPILTFGIPRALNMYENFPFWCAFLVECGFKVVLSDTSSTGLFEKGTGTVMSDNICFPAKLAHGHVVNLIEKGVDRIFYPTVVYENKEHRDTMNSYNCPVVTGYPDVLRSSIDPEGKYGIPMDSPVISFKDISLLKKQLYFFTRQFGISKKLVYQAVDKGIATHREYKNQLKGMAVKIVDNAGAKNRLVVVLAGRPYHVDPLVNHGIPELLAGMGVDVIPEDAVPVTGKCALKDSNILTQWSYTNRLLAAAKYVADTEYTELVQITSFGCGLDAISADEAREIIKDAGKIYTLIKMDEIANLGAVKIRLRSMLEAVNGDSALFSQRVKEVVPAASKKGAVPIYREKTIIVPWFSPLYSPPMPAVSRTLGHKLEVLPPPDRSSVDTGLKYVNNDMCYPAVIVIGDIIKALQSGKHDPKRTAVMLTQTGGQCRASNYVPLTKKALISAGFTNVPVLSLSMDDTNLQPGFTIDKKGLIKRLGMALIFTDALARMYLATAAREINAGESEAIHKEYLSRMEKWVEEADFGRLLNLLKEAISEFNMVDVTNEPVPVVGVLGEIFVKYNSFSNNNIVEWLIGQGVEVVVPSLTGFFTQRFINEEFDQKAHLKHSMKDRLLTRAVDKYTRYYLSRVEKVMQNFRYYRKPHDLKGLAKAASNATSLANQAGEGWLLPAEMIAMLEDGTGNIVCLQPFGCLANHITGSGLERRLKTLYPQLNLLSLNMDPGTSEVNILNRLHFMVIAAREEMNSKSEAINRSINRQPLAEPYFLTRSPAILKEYMLLEVGKWK
ncbi:MAG: 2-hydroxyacyl-CoA dehydratase, partial [Deltaproteobacteria bacterium]|nr:2-hydroxyacyl-CoA dehydratase [Deltaproteobacteria bacterium]